jgi:2-haloacid dehalogenase
MKRTSISTRWKERAAIAIAGNVGEFDSEEIVMPLKLPVAILFDTFGSVVDWRTSLVGEFADIAERRGITGDWESVAIAWRMGYHHRLGEVVAGTRPWNDLGIILRGLLVEIVRERGIVGLSEGDIDHLNLGWRRLQPWPDAVQGIARLKTRYIVGPLSNGSVRLLVDMAKAAGLGWDVIFGSDIFQSYKPDPATYLGAARLLGLEPRQLMLASAHNADLAHARRNGLMTAFFPRPTEYGAGQTSDLAPEQEWDVTAEDIGDLATKLGC